MKFYPFACSIIPFICHPIRKIFILFSKNTKGMNYTEKYYELKSKFKLNGLKLKLDEQVDMYTMPFYSENQLTGIIEATGEPSFEMLTIGMPDTNFYNNNSFAYPIFIPRERTKYSKALILLHGLNERFWDKYLPWAYYLALYTKRPVILFPLSFHMNRAPQEWADPKLMAPLVDKRKIKYPTDSLTFVNVALSSRLTEEPLRFMRSGYQSAKDLIHLSKLIESGSIPVFEKGTKPDFFSYSIGAFVSQILLLANPDEMFSHSKFFLFCGGAFFKDMNGVSRLIMDKAAYEKLNEFYTSEIDKYLENDGFLGTFLKNDILGKAFYAMLKKENNSNYREERFGNLINQIHAISLEKDQVIPAVGIDNVLKYPFSSVEITETVDFPYEYNHENPFPVCGRHDRHVVDFWFTEVFKQAAGFLN